MATLRTPYWLSDVSPKEYAEEDSRRACNKERSTPADPRRNLRRQHWSKSQSDQSCSAHHYTDVAAATIRSGRLFHGGGDC